MKLYLLTLPCFIGAIAKRLVGIATLTTVIAITPSVYAMPKPSSAIIDKGDQAAKLVTEAATITSKWNIVSDRTKNTDGSLRVSDPECKKINPMKYLNNPESFFQPCPATNNSNRQNYEPIEYLKVPRLDSGLSVTVTNF